MNESTQSLIKRYNNWSNKLSCAATRSDKNAAKQMCDMYKTALFQRNVKVK